MDRDTLIERLLDGVQASSTTTEDPSYRGCGGGCSLKTKASPADLEAKKAIEKALKLKGLSQDKVKALRSAQLSFAAL